VEDDFLDFAHWRFTEWGFCDGPVLRSASDQQSNTYSDFRKGFARAWRKSVGFLRFFARGPRAQSAGGGAATASSRIAWPGWVSTADLLPQCGHFATFRTQRADSERFFGVFA
jgi:hypothetical protein